MVRRNFYRMTDLQSMERTGVASDIPAAGIAEASAESMVGMGRSSLCKSCKL